MKENHGMKRMMMLFAMILLVSLQSIARNVPERVEPPFWWAGMYHKELQIMVYGEDIGQTRVKIDHPGVKLREVVAVESPNYLFLYLDLTNAQPGRFDIEFVSGRRTRYTYSYELLEREENARYHQGFDNSDAIYLLMPDRFANGNPALDNLPGMLENVDRTNPDARQGGDIQGIINHLDHIAGMGFTAIWINPLLENNQPRYSYHGYATTDFYNIDARFGGNEDYVRLVKEAENKGLKIIKDKIFNHCGHHHWWMKDLPSADWLNQWDEFTRTSYRMSTIVDPYFAQSDYNVMMDGWFDTNMPDLNQRNRLLALYLIQNSVWWIEYAGIHGIRMDTQPYADRFFMSDWAAYVMAEYPNFNIVGESWSGNPVLTSYFQGGRVQHDGYDSNIPTVFDFALFDDIGLAFQEEQGWSSGMMRLYNTLTQDFLYANPYNLVIFGDNHDTDRFYTRVAEDLDKLKMAIAFLVTTRGIPQFYTGIETLESFREHEGHGRLRSTFPGGWPGDPVNAFTREGRTAEQNEIVDYLTKLLNYRKDKEVIHYGWLRHFVPENNIYVYFRYNEDETVMVVLNNNAREMELDMRRFQESTQGYNMATDIISGQVFRGFGTWRIPANTALILELQ
jgi:neopullulanase